MYKISLLNSISDCIYDILDKDRFTVGETDTPDAVLLRSADLHDKELPSSLLAIGRAGAGVNNIPIEDCTQQGVAVFNTPGANANAVKELVLCGMLLAGRGVVPAMRWLQEEHAKGTSGLDKLAEKVKSNYVGPELIGRRLGVVGLGAIGVLVANAATNGLGMHVTGYDPYLSVEAAMNLTRAVARSRDLDGLYADSDFITLHLPLTADTKGMIGKKELAAMKQGAVLLNFARGGLVDDEAVLEALRSGRLRHYVTDFPNDTVTGQPGVIAIPHLGASTPESEENCAVMAAGQVADYLTNGNILNSVNLPDCSLSRSGGVRVTVINRNETNMVGQMTAVLAAEGLNIDNMLNKSRKDIAYTIFELGSAPSEGCLKALGAIEGVVRLRVLP